MNYRLCLLLCLVSSFFLSFSLADRASVFSTYTNCYVFGRTTQAFFGWTFNDTHLKGALSTTSQFSWLGIGFNFAQQMIGADYVIGIRDPNTGVTTTKDYYTDSKFPCLGPGGSFVGTCPIEVYGGKQTTVLTSSENVNGQWTFQFVKPRVSTDKWHVSLTPGNVSSVALISAFGVNEGQYIPKHLSPSPFLSLIGPLNTNPGIGACAPVPTIAPVPTPVVLPLIDWNKYNFTYMVNNIIRIGWILTSNNTAVSFAVEMASQGWVGFGFSTDNSGEMVPGDVYVCNNGETANRYLTLSYDGVNAAGVLPDSDFRYTDGKIQYIFTRSLLNILPNNQSVDPSKLTAIYAFSTSNNVVQRHSSGDCGGLQVNLLTGDVTSVRDSSKIIAHGWLMWAGWALLVPIAAAIARFMKKTIGVWWFRLHIILMVIALAAVIAAFGIIVSESKVHFESAHARLGLATFIVAMIQPILGFIADRMFDPNRDKTPVFPDMLHWLFGWSALIMAVINIWLGIDLYGSPTVIYILWGIHFAILCLVLIVWAIVYQVSSSK